MPLDDLTDSLIHSLPNFPTLASVLETVLLLCIQISTNHITILIQ